MPENYEEIIMGLITHAGSCKSLAFAALQSAKKQEHARSLQLLADAEALLNKSDFG